MCSCIEGIPKCTNCFTDRKLRCLGHPISIVMFCDRSHENKEMITIRGTNARHNNRQYCPYNQKMIPTVSFCTFVSFFLFVGTAETSWYDAANSVLQVCFLLPNMYKLRDRSERPGIHPLSMTFSQGTFPWRSDENYSKSDVSSSRPKYVVECRWLDVLLRAGGPSYRMVSMSSKAETEEQLQSHHILIPGSVVRANFLKWAWSCNVCAGGGCITGVKG